MNRAEGADKEHQNRVNVEPPLLVLIIYFPKKSLTSSAFQRNSQSTNQKRFMRKHDWCATDVMKWLARRGSSWEGTDAVTAVTHSCRLRMPPALEAQINSICDDWHAKKKEHYDSASTESLNRPFNPANKQDIRVSLSVALTRLNDWTKWSSFD